MRYFFILGSNAVLSSAEIIALLDGRYFTITATYKHALIVDAVEGQKLNVEQMMSRLGGTVKIGEIIEEDLDIIPDVIINKCSEYLLGREDVGGKLVFGYSVYSLNAESPARHAATVFGKVKRVGMIVKKRLNEAGRNARWVTNKQGSDLSSVIVAKNDLIEYGAEFVVLAKGDKFHLGVTKIVQPFEEFSQSDYGRPERDTVQGMLPPKLARIMVNLIHVSRELKDLKLLDPFCGSGTILSESLKVGFTHIIGSDKNKVAVESTQKNLDWMSDHWLEAHPEFTFDLRVSDAREIGNLLPAASVDAIVTEPYLGPPMKGRESRGQMQKQLHELSRLYRESLTNWRKCLKPGSPVVIALPVYIYGLEKHGISLKEILPKGYSPDPLMPSMMLSRLGTKETKNRGLLYGRLKQHVWREIIRLRYEPEG
jgi:tRNA G10  N-methylase Trm11